ncbi:MAG: hypothetical protein WD509_01790 [Candidatus Paceibacterota bacterium]
MPRRKTKNTTGIRGTGTVDATVVYRVLQCSNPECEGFLQISEDDIEEGDVDELSKCPACGTVNTPFVLESPRWKYCRVCERLQPLESFHKHKVTGKSFRSGRQLECADCKNSKINPVLNPLRTADQHRESSEGRRLYGFLSGESKKKIDSKEIHKRFEGKCFNCERELEYEAKGPKEMHLDHTFPAKLLWPLHFGPTLLCRECNGRKHEVWPADFYTAEQLKKLSVLTGIPHELLAGKPHVNPKAVQWLVKNIDEILVRWIRYPNEVKRIRRMVQDLEGVDIFANATTVPRFLKED